MCTPMRNKNLNPAEQPVGIVATHGRYYRAECFRCGWSLRKKHRDDAISLLRSHNRIAHPPRELIYQETP